MTDAISEALSALQSGPDINVFRDILQARTDAARLSDCASAVDHRGRRNIVAREVRCRRARPVPKPANDDKKTEGVIFGPDTIAPDCPVTITFIKGETDGPPTAS